MELPVRPFLFRILCMHMHFQRCRVDFFHGCPAHSTPNKPSSSATALQFFPTAHLTVSLGVPNSARQSWRGQWIACGSVAVHGSPPQRPAWEQQMPMAHDRRGSVASEPGYQKWDQFLGAGNLSWLLSGHIKHICSDQSCDLSKNVLI